MTIDLDKMKIRLEAKQDELRTNISGLTEAHPVPTDPIEASDGPNDFEDLAVDFLEIQKEQSLLVNELVDRRVLSEELVKIIKSEQTETLQNRKLLNIICEKTDYTQFEEFLVSLWIKKQAPLMRYIIHDHQGLS